MPDDESVETQPASDVPPAGVVRTGDSPFDPPPPEQRFIEAAELGRGGMGRVFEAHDSALDRPVAIKQSLGNEPSLIARFEREVRITAKLQHPAIVPILDAGRDAQGRPYYVMRRIDGKPLVDRIAATKTLAERLALVPHVLAAVDACAYAHARGVIHRDIKPWNVLVGPFGETLLIDWGLARELELGTTTLPPEPQPTSAGDELTRAGAAYGTPGFMAPEQARGEMLDRRADVFALGATLYHVLVGKRPLAGSSATEAVDLAASGEHVARLPDEIPAELAAIVTKAMASNRRERYADARELAEDLRRFTTGQLVAAHRYTLRELIVRWLKRHRFAVAIAAISLVVSSIVGVIAIRGVIEARVQADFEAERAADHADEVVISHAEEVVSYDPTRAVALLRDLRKGSRMWPRASAVFESAKLRGIARGRFAHRGAVATWVTASPDGKLVASTSTDGAILVHDPSFTTPPRTIAMLDAPRQLRWVEPNTMVVLKGNAELVRVALDGQVQPMGMRARSLLDVLDGRLFAITDHDELREIDLGRGSHFAPVPGIYEALRLPEALLYIQGEKAIYQRLDGPPIELAKLESNSVSSLVASADGTRFAISSYNGTFEWELRDAAPVERGRWSISANGMLYVEHTLIGQEAGRAVWLFPNKPPIAAPAPRGYLHARASNKTCGFAATWTGELWKVCAGVETQIARGGEAINNMLVTRDHLIAATPTGLLLSWDLEEAAPVRHIGMKGKLRIPGIYAGGNLWTQSSQLMALDVETGSEAELGFGVLLCYGPRYGVYGSMPLDREQGLFAVDLQTRKFVHFGPVQRVTCSFDGRAAVANGRRVELRDLSSPGTILSTIDLPFDADGLALDNNWLVAVDRAGHFVRFDLRTGISTRTTIENPNAFSVDRDGRVAVARDADVILWTLETQRPFAVPSGVDVIANPAGLAIITRDRSVNVIAEDGTLRTFHEGSQFKPSVAFTAPFAILPTLDNQLAIVDLRDGRLVRIPTSAQGAVMAVDGSVVVGWNSSDGLIWKVPAMRSEDDIRAEIERTTNAAISKDSSRVEFR